MNQNFAGPSSLSNTSSVVRTLWSVPQASRQRPRVNRHDAGNVSLTENILYFCFEKHTQVGGARGRARERGAGLRGRGLIRTLERNMGGACHSRSLSLWAARHTRTHVLITWRRTLLWERAGLKPKCAERSLNRPSRQNTHTHTCKRACRNVNAHWRLKRIWRAWGETACVSY